MTNVTRIAMWSGPRNISTAMMRSWGSRGDTVVCDEPLYAHYLQQTRATHPGAGEIMDHHETDAARVVSTLLANLPPGRSIFYQKHMAHHLLPGMDTTWVGQLSNCVLIREPRAMLLSLSRVLDDPDIDATGLPQQVGLFEQLAAHGTMPTVIDSRDVLENPRGMLAALCDSLDVPFDEAMLTWEAGPRETDGIWAPYWYDSVNASTGFAPYSASDRVLPPEMTELGRQCNLLYDKLHAHRLTVRTTHANAPDLQRSQSQSADQHQRRVGPS